MNNKRYIEYGNIVVGYNYVKQQFYITNKGKTLYSNSAEDILSTATEVFHIEGVTLEAIEECKTEYETINKLSYTLQDNGAYIHTIQLNEFKQNPLTIDCEKHKLYIMNSNVIFDLQVDESITEVVIPTLRQWYKDMLGLYIETKDMKALYDLIMSYYRPTCYNQITTDTNDILYYNNIYLLSNYNNTSPAVYNCTRNPNKTSDNKFLTYILSTDTNSNEVQFVQPITDEDMEKYSIKAGSSLVIQGVDIELAESNYSADGTYTIQSLLADTENNILGAILEETLPISYQFPYPTCYIESAEYSIISMSREDNIIKVTTLPTNILIGDTIHVYNAQVTSKYEVINCSGEYTVTNILSSSQQLSAYITSMLPEANTIALKETPTDLTTGMQVTVKGTDTSNDNTYTISNIEDNILTVAENIPVEYTTTENNAYILYKKVLNYGIEVDEDIPTDYTGTEATLTKEIPIGNIKSVEETTITLTKAMGDLFTDIAGSHVYMYNIPNTETIIKEVASNTETTITLTEEAGVSYNAEEEYPQLLYPNPSEETLINITSVDESIENVFPRGEFIVDNFQEVQDYISKIAQLTYPSTTNYNNMYKRVPNIIALTEAINGVETMELMGLYSEVYSMG